MKLQRLQIQGYKNLDNIEVDFKKSLGQALVVGTNGSGKSNLLEAISAIFAAVYNHDANIYPDFRFELEYAISNPPSTINGRRIVGPTVFVRIRNADGVIEVSYCDPQEDTDYQIVSSDWQDGLLPNHVIAVYSGEEQRLWEDYYFKAYDTYNRQYMDGKSSFRQQRMVYLNKYYWNLISSILLIHEIEDYRKFIHESIGLTNVVSIHCEFDLSKLKRNKNERARQILQIINPNNEKEIDISLETYAHVRDYCGYEADMFYNMLVLNLYKDYKIITDLTLKCDNGIEIKDLSEGEKKLLLVYGAINLLSGENLYLFDEPDAHLHEGRKKEIFDLIQQDSNSQFLISSHSPTLTKLFDSDHVIFLEKTESGSRVSYGNVSATISALTDGEWSYIDHTIFFDKSRPLVLVEGEGDVKYIQKAIELLSTEKQEYELLKNLDILHCGGAANVAHTIAELMPCLPERKKVIVVFDRDDEGGLGLKKLIGKGKDRKDTKTYHRDQFYYFKLPKTSGYTFDTFVIEDYFSITLKKEIAQAKLDSVNGDFNGFPRDLKQQIKDQLAKDLPTYSADALRGFGVLLDKIHQIIIDTEPLTEV